MKFEGIVNVLKPTGMTSSDVVVDIRKIFGEKRVGHTGTLDPAAAGVLPCCIGRATRLFDYLADREKEYIAEIRFGIATDTEDAFGAVKEKSEKKVKTEELTSALKRFTGEITQIPPVYSSLSVNGERMYKLARRGQVTEPVIEKKRRITIYSLELLEKLNENSFLIKIRCSKGTYIRTLVNDIGKAVGIPAYMPFLLRTASGEFRIESAYTFAELKELKEKGKLASAVMPCDEAVKTIPKLNLTGLSDKKRKMLVNGASVPCEQAENGVLYRIYNDNEFLGLGRKNGEGLHITLWLGQAEKGGGNSSESSNGNSIRNSSKSGSGNSNGNNSESGSGNGDGSNL